MILKRITAALLGMSIASSVGFTAVSAEESEKPADDNAIIVVEPDYEIYNAGAELTLTLDENMLAHVRISTNSPENPDCCYYDEDLTAFGKKSQSYLFTLDAIDDAVYTVSIFVPEYPYSENGQTYKLEDFTVENTAYGDDIYYSKMFYNISYSEDEKAETPSESLVRKITIESELKNEKIQESYYNLSFKGSAYNFGDVNNDLEINASDASLVLSHYASVNTGGKGVLSESIQPFADVNSDKLINASDASIILSYYSYKSTGGTGTLLDYINKK